MAAVSPLRAVGGATCLAAIVVAAVTARWLLREPTRRTRFISEILAIWLRRGRDGATGAGWWGAALAGFLLAAGSIVFAVEATQRVGLDCGASLATSLSLLAVALIPLRELADPTTARGLDFAHPLAAAAFYLAAALVGVMALDEGGPVGRALAVVHLASSAVLIAMSVATSFFVFGWRGAFPIAGIRILLDLRPDSPARWIRWFQWPATFAVGVALLVEALGW